MKEEDKSKLVEVFTGSPWEAELVKSLLGNSDIEAVTKDGMVVTLYCLPLRRCFRSRQ